MARRVLGTMLIALLIVQSAWALPEHKDSLGRYYTGYLDAGLHACATCHIVPPGVSEKDLAAEAPEHNDFGRRLRIVGEELDEQKKPADMFSRLKLIAAEDADGDGSPNELELMAGSRPGDAEDRPTDLTAANQRWQKFQSRYEWTPFETVKRPEVPTAGEAWARNSIDRFVAAEHKERGLSPVGEAPPHVLLRRVYLDLVGLPPTREELNAFLADKARDAYEKVVDQLLTSPRYGERWGRHWMDVWRYSDWAGWEGGNQIRDSQPHIWRWRDWIIESLAADKPYDQMIKEMLAGDELAPTDPSILRATGYLVRNYKMLSREQWMQDTVDHTAQAMLGITLKCARCHDHKYDPFPHEAYYQMRAVFEPYQVRIDRLPGVADTKLDGLARVYDAKPEPTYLYLRGDERTPDKDHPLSPGVPGVLADAGFEIKAHPISLPKSAYAPDNREFVIQDLLESALADVEKAKQLEVAAQEKIRSQQERLAEAAAADRQAKQKLSQVDELAQAAAAGQQTPEGLTEAREAVNEAAAALDEARTGLTKAQRELKLMKFDVPLAEAKERSLAATIKVERLDADNTKQSYPEAWRPAAEAAVVAQRELAVVQAQQGMVVAEDKVEDRRQAKVEADGAAAREPDVTKLKGLAEKRAKELEAAEKKLAETREGLQKAEELCRSAPTTDYKPRDVKTYPNASSGRRLAFAQWVVDQKNPLAARVAVNQIWMRHFGAPLVPSVFDFGAGGQLPSHPALVDWLAAEFMQPSGTAGRWTMKHLHRLIVTSSTYRMASTRNPEAQAIDPDNHYLWRMNPRRMEAELVRDSVLYVAGTLDLARGGPDLDYGQGLEIKRRSLYFQHAPEKQMQFLKLFDAAGPDECYQRKESIMPQQALALANSPLAWEQARLLARRLSGEFAERTEAFVAAAFEQVLSRHARPDEVKACIEFLAAQAELLAKNQAGAAETTQHAGDGLKPSADPALRAKENLVLVLLNHHDFVTIH